MKTQERIGIHYLKEIWSHYHGLKNPGQQSQQVEWKYINGVFNTLGIGIEPTVRYILHSSNSFDDFENWILENGRVSKNMVLHFNSIIENGSTETPIEEEKIFNEKDLEHWNREGYVILKNAVPKEDCEKSVNFICEKIGADLSDKKTWYTPHPLKQGIMVQLFNAPILDKNRFAQKIKNAFEQLWQKKNLMVSMDRVSFNPPETETYQFQGPNLHWDVSLKQPIPFGIQGLLYINDVKEEQGAFTLIPGFHNIIDSWLNKINKNPREINLLDSFDEKPIAGNAGDLIIWNHCLPHGSRPNLSTFPRIVQYINYQPLDLEYQNEWI